jgi:purine-binding chemotaxis protein CheW
LARFEKNPPNLALRWQEVAAGVYRLDNELLVVIDIAGLLRF